MRADFYLIAKPRFRDQPLLLVCELARRGHDSGKPMLILARDRPQAEAIDDLLWSFDPDAYIPHQIAREDDPGEDVPVLIASPEIAAALRPLTLNLRDQPVDGPVERILEVVPADPTAREPLRQRWRAYQARSFQLNKHDM